VHLIDANPRDALWASEQCLRSGCLSAVLGWPMQADDRALRRLQVAADTGGVMGFVFRDARAGRNPSPAALRIAIESTTADGGSTQLRVLKCRGGTAPVKPVLLRDASSSSPFATRSDLRNAECGSVKASVISLPAAIGEKRPEDPAVYSPQGRMRGAPGTA
jgi:hypothetical protein